MELKDYQQTVLERLSFYLKVLKEKRQNALALAEIKKKIIVRFNGIQRILIFATELGMS